MIDLHSHLLYDTDDGVENLKEAIKQIKQAQKNGITKICLTPHYIEPNYIKTVEENKEKFEAVKEELEKQNINVDLFLGNEIFINGDVVKNIEENKVSTINNTSYVLVELPMYTEIKNIKDILERITDSGYSVIIAHPERYMCVQKNINLQKPRGDRVYPTQSRLPLHEANASAERELLSALPFCQLQDNNFYRNRVRRACLKGECTLSAFPWSEEPWSL